MSKFSQFQQYIITFQAVLNKHLTSISAVEIANISFINCVITDFNFFISFQ